MPFAQRENFCTNYFIYGGMRKTRRKQLVEIKGRKTGRKLTRRIIIEFKLVEELQITHRDCPVLIMDSFLLIDTWNFQFYA